MSEAEAAHTAAGLGWELDPAAGMLTVVKPPVTEQQQLVGGCTSRMQLTRSLKAPGFSFNP